MIHECDYWICGFWKPSPHINNNSSSFQFFLVLAPLQSYLCISDLTNESSFSGVIKLFEPIQNHLEERERERESEQFWMGTDVTGCNGSLLGGWVYLIHNLTPDVIKLMNEENINKRGPAVCGMVKCWQHLKKEKSPSFLFRIPDCLLTLLLFLLHLLFS